MNSPHESIVDRLRRAALSLGPLDYAVTLALLVIYVVGTSMDEGPGTSIDFYRAATTVIPTLLITVAIQGRVFELSRKVTFRLQYRTVLFAIVVFAGEAGALMTVGREKTNWAAHLYVYLALVALGVTLIYLALTGEQAQAEKAGDVDSAGQAPR